MNAKKQKAKQRRRARKLADQAWEAADAQNLALAERLIRRAVATQPENPALWHDQGMLLRLNRQDAEAETSFRTVLSLAPSFADAYAELARLRLEQGRAEEAVALQEQAVKHAPQDERYTARLESYRALRRQPASDVAAPVARDVKSETSFSLPPCGPALEGLTEKLERSDWAKLEEQLTHAGVCVLQELIDAPVCAVLRAMFGDDSQFAKTVVMDRPSFGNGVYRYFRAPLPAAVDELRRSVYPYAAGIANAWQRLLHEAPSYPERWDDFADRCREAGQTTTTPLLLKYVAGGFNALHRDLRGSVYFPIQMAVVLSPRRAAPAPDGFCGGEFLLCDVPERRKSRRRSIAAGLGDAVLFCTRDRLVCIGGAWGLQPVKHGVSPVTTGTRFVLGVPFHEYR